MELRKAEPAKLARAMEYSGQIIKIPHEIMRFAKKIIYCLQP